VDYATKLTVFQIADRNQGCYRFLQLAAGKMQFAAEIAYQDFLSGETADRDSVPNTLTDFVLTLQLIDSHSW